MPCEPAVLLGGFPYLIKCDNGYWVFREMKGDKPLYAFIPTSEALRLEYIMRKIPEAEVVDDFFDFMKGIEHREVSREVMKTAAKAYRKLREAFPEEPKHWILSALLATTWKKLYEKGRLTENDVDEIVEATKERLIRGWGGRKPRKVLA